MTNVPASFLTAQMSKFTFTEPIQVLLVFALGRGGGYSIYRWVGRCGPASHTLTLFKTKIADFPTLSKTEFRFLIPCLRHLTRNHTLCKTIINIETLSYLIHSQSQNYFNRYPV